MAAILLSYLHEHTEQCTSVVWPYKLCTIFGKMKTYSVATSKTS